MENLPSSTNGSSRTTKNGENNDFTMEYLEAKLQNDLYSNLSFVDAGNGNLDSSNSSKSGEALHAMMKDLKEERNRALYKFDGASPKSVQDDINSSLATTATTQTETTIAPNEQAIPHPPIVSPSNNNNDTTKEHSSVSTSPKSRSSSNSSLVDSISSAATEGMTHYFKKTQQHLQRDIQRSQENVTKLQQDIQLLKAQDSNENAQCSAILDEMIEYEATTIRYQLRVAELTNELSQTQTSIRDLQENLHHEQQLGKQLEQEEQDEQKRQKKEEQEQKKLAASSSRASSFFRKGRRSLGVLGSFRRSSHQKGSQQGPMQSPYDLGDIPEQVQDAMEEGYAKRVVDEYAATGDDHALDFENDDDSVLSAWTTMTSPTGGKRSIRNKSKTKKTTTNKNPFMSTTKSTTSTASTSTTSSSSWVQTENSVVDSYDELRELRHDMTLLRLKKTIEQLQLRQQYHFDSTSNLRKVISEMEMENSKLMIQIQQYEEMHGRGEEDDEAEGNPDNTIVC